jgi:hypothetical protein
LVLGFEKYDYKTNDQFLCQTLKALNEFKYDREQSLSDADEIFQDIDYRLRESMKVITSIFGMDAYKKEPNGKLNKILFELLVSIFAMMSDKQRDLTCIPQNSTFIRSSLWKMIEDDESPTVWESEVYEDQSRGFNYAISNSTGKRVTVLFRFRCVVNMLNAIRDLNFSPVGLLENKNL